MSRFTEAIAVRLPSDLRERISIEARSRMLPESALVRECIIAKYGNEAIEARAAAQSAQPTQPEPHAI